LGGICSDSKLQSSASSLVPRAGIRPSFKVAVICPHIASFTKHIRCPFSSYLRNQKQQQK
jgi:hypothetical protein